jgi:hypothetical protein
MSCQIVRHDRQDVVVNTCFFQQSDPFKNAQESTFSFGVITEMIMIGLIAVKTDAEQEFPVMQELTELFCEQGGIRLHGPVHLNIVKTVHGSRKLSEPVNTCNRRFTALETDIGSSAFRQFLMDPLCQNVHHVILHDTGRSDFAVFTDVSVKTIPAPEIAQ